MIPYNNSNMFKKGKLIKKKYPRIQWTFKPLSYHAGECSLLIYCMYD